MTQSIRQDEGWQGFLPLFGCIRCRSLWPGARKVPSRSNWHASVIQVETFSVVGQTKSLNCLTTQSQKQPSPNHDLTLASGSPLIFPSARPQPGHRLNSENPQLPNLAPNFDLYSQVFQEVVPPRAS